MPPSLSMFFFRTALSRSKYVLPPLYGVVSYFEYNRAVKEIDAAPKPTITWPEVSKTLQTGDLLFLRGTGDVSQKICLMSFLWFDWRTEALLYSHVGVIIRRGDKVFLLEAIDNVDVKTKDVEGEVRFKQVQLVDPANRIFGVTDTERRCYMRCGVRRLVGSPPIPMAEDYVKRNVGRAMDAAKLMVLAYVHPSLYTRESDRVTCSELVADLYKEAGIIAKKDNAKASIAYSPMHLAFDTPADLGFASGVKMMPVQEVKI